MPKFKPDKIIIHHTATPKYLTEKDIEQLHMDRRFNWSYRGMKGYCGYHFIILPETGLRNKALIKAMRPIQIQGAHALPNCSAGIGISVIGYYHSPFNHTLRDSDIGAIIHVCYKMCKTFNISPDKIYGHRNINSTDCPGDNIYKYISHIKEKVKEKLN